MGFLNSYRYSSDDSPTTTLVFDDISNAPVANVDDVAQWNTLFDLPTKGIEYTSVSVDVNTVTLTGGADISLIVSAFGTAGATNSTNLIEIVDTGCIVSIEQNGLRRQIDLTTAHFSNVTDIASNTFTFDASLTDLSMPLLANSTGGSNFQQTGLVDVSLPSYVTIQNSDFNSCASLETGTFASATSIGNDSFTTCGSLLSVTASLVTSIGDRAFNASNNITSAIYPNCLSIGTQSFRASVATGSLTSIDLRACTTVANSAMFRRNGLTTIRLDACTSLGTTTGNNSIFGAISGNTIDCYLPVGTRTDGDATSLASTNTVTFLP